MKRTVTLSLALFAVAGGLGFYFSHLAALDTDLDGLPDSWEKKYFGNLEKGPNDDTDKDGLTNLQEYRQGSDPADFYSQGAKTVEVKMRIVGGNLQMASKADKVFLPEALQVEVYDAQTDQLLPHVPVDFYLNEGEGGMALHQGDNKTNYEVIAWTDAKGRAQVYYKQGFQAGVRAEIFARASQATEVFNLCLPDPAEPPVAAPGTPVITEEHGSSTALIEWKDNSDNETCFYIDRKVYGKPWKRLATVPANTTSYTDDTVVPDQIYKFRVVAHRDAPEKERK